MKKGCSMRGACVLALIASVCGLIKADTTRFSGFLGCRFSRSVCRRHEECVDDQLFGTCQTPTRAQDSYRYVLSTGQLRDLEGEITRLIQTGYTWEDLYTQCVLSNILLAYRRRQPFDPDFCDPSGTHQVETPDVLSSSAVDLLKLYLEEYYQALANGESERDFDSSLSPYNVLKDDMDGGSIYQFPPDYFDQKLVEAPNHQQKKDEEVVQIHKYLKSHKRDPSFSVDYYNSDSTFQQPGDYQSFELSPDYDNLLDSLSPDKLALLEEYFGPLSKDNSPDDTDLLEPQAQDTEPDDGQTDSDSEFRFQPVSDKDAVAALMTPEDAQLLDNLLQGKASVSDLSDDKINRLTQYVDSMLSSLRDMETGQDVSMETEVHEPEDSPVVDEEITVDDKGNPDDVISENEGIHEAVKKEQLNIDVLADSSSDEERQPLDHHDHHDHHFDDLMTPVPTPAKYGLVDFDVAFIKVKPKFKSEQDAARLLTVLEQLLMLPNGTITDAHWLTDDEVNFRVRPNSLDLKAANISRLAEVKSSEIKNATGYQIYQTGVGEPESEVPLDSSEPKYIVLTFVLVGVIAGVVLAVLAIYVVRRHLQSKEKLAQLAGTADGVEASNDYQDLCRQRMQSKSSEKPEPLHVAARVGSVSATEGAVASPSSRSSTSSWSEEPVTSNMDISTGHIVLSYMEDHLKNKDRLDQEWEALCSYEAEPNSTATATEAASMRKNRYSDVLPYDHSRVVLSSATNVSGSDYINASTIMDHDPRNPAYIATQGPLPHTVADFWQMIWEQGSVVIVNLTKLTESGQAMCHRYWPEEGSDLYHIYEVHLVSEHIWCDDYLVRSFYLKNLQTNETRTVTQFHFLTWLDLGVPATAKALLDFRRKVNKSYRGRSCPIVVHCSDGSGRSGTYCLLDMVLNRMSKGAKEIDIAATLEHIRDQRMLIVKTKEQLEFALAAVAEEVHAILKSLAQ